MSAQLKMLVSLASSVAAGCRYCQSHMTNLSSIYDVPDDKIGAVWGYESSPLFNPAEKAAIAVAIKAGSVPNEVDAADFDQLSAHFDEDQIVEIIASIALFGFLNRWNDTMATSVEPLPAEVARRTAGSAGWEPGKHR